MRVNEIFYSLQGEGHFTGTPAIFLRLAGCNLACDFCDTDFQAYKDLTEEEIMREIKNLSPAKHVVITGGEPTLQLTANFVHLLHDAGKFVQIETNGTIPLKQGLETLIDWITCSPKYKEVKIQRIDEVKVVYQGQDMSQYDVLSPTHDDCWYLQPCDVKDEEKNRENVKDTVNYILHHPKWKLSLQTHKILGVR